MKMKVKILPHFLTVTAVVLLLVLGLGSAGSSPRAVDTVELFWDTAVIQNVTRLTDDGLPKRMPRVSPDGRMLMYGELQRDQWHLILLRDVNIPAKTPLASNAFNSYWFPNNNNYLYVTIEGGRSRILRSAITGGGRTYVTRNPVGNNDDLPSIRGDVVLFQTDTGNNPRDPRWQIASMRDNGTEITFLGEGETPSWHPREPKFLFIRQPPGDTSKIFEMDMRTLQITELFSDPVFNSRMPSYSADGQYILFQKGAERIVTGSARAGGAARRVTGTVDKWQIYIMRSDGTQRSTVTLDAVNSFHPSMDANGNIYFISDASGKTEIYRARVNLN